MRYRYDRYVGVDQTYICKEEVPYKNMTIVAGFKDLMTREMLERGLDVPRKYSDLIKALKAHENNHK